uniref:Transmembrane 9 superfamily member n=1 Tax=Zea mays TaxID=4577 RepID=A0A804PYB5_MAIZE
MVAMIMMITLYKDITNYNQLDDQDEAQEETGWKLVHGDVFRAPVHSSLLCVYAGTSVQFFGMTLLTMMFALLGFLSPANRGGLMTAMVLFWVFMGVLAVPFGTMFALFLLWFGISVSLVFVGSFLGFKQLAIEDPVKTNKIHRQITEQAWYLQPVFAILASGILPFGTVFIELFFILTSIWLNQFYYIFGFLFKVFVVLVVTCVEITIVICYF